jgi:peptide deformylase
MGTNKFHHFRVRLRRLAGAQEAYRQNRCSCEREQDDGDENERQRFGHFGSLRDSQRRYERRENVDPFIPSLYIARMPLREIITLPDKRLRLVSAPIKAINDDVRKLVQDMFETMYDAPGIGLAAIQIGEPQRVVTLDLAKKDEPKDPQVFINPEIVVASEEKSTHEEGCLSIPEFYEEVERPATVTVKYLDLEGQTRQVEAAGLLATCLQHEIDHLNGVLFIDHLSKLKRDRVIKKFAKAAKRAAE